MSVTAKPFQKLSEDVSCWVRSPEWREFRFSLVLTTYVYQTAEGDFLTHDCPDGSVPFAVLYGLEATPACDHTDCLGQTWCTESGNCTHVYCEDEPVCGLPWLRTGQHCGHARCYSLLQCRDVSRPPKQVRAASQSSPTPHTNPDADVDEALGREDLDKGPVISLGPDGVPSDTIESVYDLWMYKDTDDVYLTRLNGVFLLSSEILEGDSVPVLMLGPAAKPPCRHDFCRGRSWCQSSGLCDHPGCIREKRCRLPKPRVGPHCSHKKCPSLLQCQGGRPVAKRMPVEPESPRITRSMQPRGSSVNLSASSSTLLTSDDCGPSHSSSEVEKGEGGQESSFPHFMPFDSGTDLNGDFSEANAPGSDAAESIQDVADVDHETPQNGSDCNSDDIAGVSVAASKRKAEELDDDGQDAAQDFSGSEEAGVAPPVAGSTALRARSVFGVHSTGESVDTRLLAVLRTLGQRHQVMTEGRALEFVAHHEGRPLADPLPLYFYASPSSTSIELEIQIGNLENEIHYCLDLYHTARESESLGSGQVPASRGDSWFDRKAKERCKKRRAE
ncbi:hypothetical protein B0O80DRAFT_452395 [Mortierella sp. GBAus27b]|nr:hypothetical protein B0O80DRAFT_473322 [Mortierella sp. GBAus27b]KAI8353526.1 hypothetical protein B0O80DRAFT_452395 [Mortierella sp. GBAus27b]